MECRNANWKEWCRNRLGKKNKLWKGGSAIVSGYRYIKAYEHPNKNSGEYMAEHRLVMEKKLGRYLTSNEEVHHRNQNKLDNRINNLEVVLKKAHFGTIICPHCTKEIKIK